MRQIKSRLVAITGRVQKVRDELEHLLDDDDDMAEMYLTEKLLEQLEKSSISSLDEQDGLGEEFDEPETDDRTVETIMEGSEKTKGLDAADPQHIDAHREQLFGGHIADSHRTLSTIHSAVSKHLDVEELEMLLEAYFVQIEGTLNKLSTLREYVDDTEDYINIMLDDKQNHLLQMGVMLTTATLVISCFVVVAGIFGMNIKIDIFDDEEHGMTRFLWTVGGSSFGCLFLYVVAIAWCKHRRLLE